MSPVKLFYRFSEAPPPSIDEVGGKGRSLITLFQAGLPVPAGFVLTVAFFEPWLVLLKATPSWKKFLVAGSADLPEACRRLQDVSAGYEPTADQKKALREGLIAFNEKTLFAVRSSSPEEDLTESSFAGIYKTVLGVTPGRLETALRATFASCLDARLVAYKRERRLETTRPRIAIVVQEQIASDVSGVGFSVNPMTNAPDEAVFESNWGLGETIVAGRVSPDRFVVAKATRTVLERRLGRKERSAVILGGGGTHEREDPRHDQLTLQDGQLQALTETLLAIERLYGRPIDMEWAFAGGLLYVLQARPIVARVPARASTAKRPGALKRFLERLTAFLRPGA